MCSSDLPDRVLSPGKYPLIVDPVIGNIRLTKVVMDGGSSLNIIYAETLRLLQIDLSTIRAGAAPFHGIIPRTVSYTHLDVYKRQGGDGAEGAAPSQGDAVGDGYPPGPLKK